MTRSFLFLQDKFHVREQENMKEFKAAEAFYIEEISEKMKMIHSVNSSDLNGFTQDFQQLEARAQERSTEFSSSRTLPGQKWASRQLLASGVK